ncbi:MAG: hypothetical protein Phog2KO_29650 [Phototrophicaceae bacterium]
MNKQLNLSNWYVFYFLTSLALTSLVGSAFAHFSAGNVAWWVWWDGALQNFSTEMLGAIITFGLIEVIVGSRDRREDLAQQLRVGDTKTLIILEDNNIKINDINLSGARWENIDLIDANLVGANLMRSNLLYGKLIHANLVGANLVGANLMYADLSGARLADANLAFANLESVNLAGADLAGVNLVCANLVEAKLENVNLAHVYLAGADLKNANLKGANLEYVRFPDGILWHEDLDIQRYTNEEHSEYVSTLNTINKLRCNAGFDEIKK